MISGTSEAQHNQIKNQFKEFKVEFFKKDRVFQTEIQFSIGTQEEEQRRHFFESLLKLLDTPAFSKLPFQVLSQSLNEVFDI